MTRLYAALFIAFAVAAAALRPGLASASELVPATGSTIQLEVSKGTLLRLSKPANSVFIADPDIADVQLKSPTLVYVYGKSGGVTTLYAVSEHDEVLFNAQVHVRYDAGQVLQAIHDLVPRSAVTVHSVDDSIVLEGTVYSAADADKIRDIAQRFVPDVHQLINEMQVNAPNQISLRVRVAEVSRAIIKQFGINWESVFDNGHIIFGLATGVPSIVGTLPTSGPTTEPNAGMNLFAIPPGSTTNSFNVLHPGDAGSAVNNLLAGVKTKSLNLNNLIDALDNHGLVTVLAEPNLTAISGEPANFLAGGEFPVPVPAGNGVVGIEWKKFGVSLNFVATLLAGNRISLHVSPEVSQLSNAGAITIDSIQVPSLTTRRADTTVELASGQAFAIAGLLQNNVTQNIDKFPWLGDVPVLGQLFRSESFQRNESELVIIVTPYIVHPIVTASRAMSPTDGYIPSTDGQLILNANEYQEQPAGPSRTSGSSSTNVVGPIGFELQ